MILGIRQNFSLFYFPSSWHNDSLPLSLIDLRGFWRRWLSYLGLLAPYLERLCLPVLDANRIQGPTDDVIPYSRKVFYPASPNKDNGVFLEVMANTGDVGSHFNAVGQSNTGDLSKGGVRFFRRGRINTDTDPPFLRRPSERWGRCFSSLLPFFPFEQVAE